MYEQNPNLTYIIKGNKITVYNKGEYPANKVFTYQTLCLIEMIGLPSLILLFTTYYNPFNHFTETLSFALVVTAVLICITSILANKPINKFYADHSNSTYTLPAETLIKLNKIKQTLRPEIANLIIETQTHQNSEKTQTLEHLINQKQEMSQHLNKH